MVKIRYNIYCFFFVRMLLILTPLLIGCSSHEQLHPVFFNSLGFYEISRQYSPDSSKVLITYGWDEGATGRGEVGTAVLHIGDTSKNIQPFTLPWYTYNNVHWIQNDTVEVFLDYLQKMRHRDFTTARDSLVNNIPIKFSYKDLIDDSYKRDTLLSQLSPDGKYNLVVYRYTKTGMRDNFLNISVVNPLDTLPKYGNFFISDIRNDYVFDCKWDGNRLVFYSTTSDQNVVPECLIIGHLPVPIEIKTDDSIMPPFKFKRN
ncbi:MAG: hypothetical protein ACJ75B_02840 [Flavisolibacter sp.]